MSHKCMLTTGHKLAGENTIASYFFLFLRSKYRTLLYSFFRTKCTLFEFSYLGTLTQSYSVLYEMVLFFCIPLFCKVHIAVELRTLYTLCIQKYMFNSYHKLENGVSMGRRSSGYRPRTFYPPRHHFPTL